jgi:hypothetical protein
LTLARTAVLAATCAAALLAPAGAARAAVAVGLADQKAASYADPRARALGLRHARLTVPWDAVTSEPAEVAAWLAAVKAAGMTPHVAFEHLTTDACPGRPCTVPSAAQYGAAVARFVARFPQVRTYTTWNEANHATQPVADRPELVAAYYDRLRAACRRCTIVAGDVLDSGSYRQWLQRFLRASATRPRLWGLHDYADVTYGRTSGVDSVLATVPGSLWIEETGGLVALRNAAGVQTLATGEATAARAIDRAFAIADARPRVRRMYVYQWRASPLDRFDAGLVRPDGTVRLSYTALTRELAAPPAWHASWSGGRLVLGATCRRAGCAGRVTVSLRAAKRTTRVAARRYRASATSRTATVRIAVPAGLRRRLRAATTRRALLAVRATRPATRAIRVSLALARPA